MRKLFIAVLLLISSSVFAGTLDCQKIQDTNTRLACVGQNIQLRNKEMEQLQQAILTSPAVPEKEKKIFYKDQTEWINNLNAVCDKEVYCANSELEQRVNDLSFYLSSFAKHK